MKNIPVPGFKRTKSKAEKEAIAEYYRKKQAAKVGPKTT